jgi:hypothetical protein
MSGAPLSDNVPLVIGGHHDSIAGLPQALPPAVRKDFAGSFTADPHTLTPARIRELASLNPRRSIAQRPVRLRQRRRARLPVRLPLARDGSSRSCQARSETVTGPGSTPATCGNVQCQRFASLHAQFGISG